MRHAVFGITDDVMENPAEHIDLMTRRVMHAGNSMVGVEADMLRFHVLCIIGHVGALSFFIDNFRNENGPCALELLMNSHLPVGLQSRGCGGFFMTPILCALLWNNTRDVVRLLCANGASLHLVDCDGRYPEEKISSIPYFDHLIGAHAALVTTGSSTGETCLSSLPFFRKFATSWAKKLRRLAGRCPPIPSPLASQVPSL